jgi:class 3 adenylate cyclase
MKERGMSMAEIAASLGSRGETPSPPPESLPAGVAEGLALTIDAIAHPAYMVNFNFELTWLNDAARSSVLGGLESMPSHTEARNVFRFLLQAGAGEELMRFHFSLAKRRAPNTGFFTLCKDAPADRLGALERLYQETEAQPFQTISETLVSALDAQGKRVPHYLYAAQFREGILFVYVEGGPGSDSLLALLARRDVVIRDLSRKRLPVLTNLVVLVADLQNSVKICSELPPEEYFELVNQIWTGMEPIFRRFYGTYGKHAGDGMVYYFFPQPDCSYVMNAVVAAHEMREVMRRISKEWQLRKGWTNELYLNTGLNEGQEWLGVVQAASHVEFTVLGDTINNGARLSDFARYGAIWSTKNFMGKLSAAERQRMKFGIRRAAEQGREVFVASTYATVGSLADLSIGRNEKLKDIAALPVTEIVEVSPAASL